MKVPAAVFTDGSLLGVGVKAVHFTEVRKAVNAMRTAAGLTPTMFTETALTGVPIKRVHITEPRSSLDQARSTMGFGQILYTDPTITVGVTTVKAAHVQQLRAGTQ